jgi:hypothetical protein
MMLQAAVGAAIGDRHDPLIRNADFSMMRRRPPFALLGRLSF